LLLDSHVVLWVLEGDRNLSSELIEALRATPRAELVVSAASLWEIAIKVAKGKLHAPSDLPARLRSDGFELLPVSPAHAWAVRSLPFSLRTRDPFDKLIVAQAKTEGLTLATRDRALLSSGVDVMPA
jgi:PIN domain nuclease of toxin-antitoxin system